MVGATKKTSQLKKKKVAILHASAGLGHVKAAQAIVEAFHKNHPEIEVLNRNIIDFCSKPSKLFFVDGYNFISSKTPFFWRWFYRTYNRPEHQELQRRVLQRTISHKLFDYIKDFNPDFILATHFFPIPFLYGSRDHSLARIPSGVVVTDYGCHALWLETHVNHYFVAAEETKQCVLKCGVNSKKIIVTGIPVGQKFLKKQNRNELLKKFDLNPDFFTLLIVGGQLNFGELKTVIKDVTKRAPAIQIVVVAGRDHLLEEKLKDSELSQVKHVKIFGFVDNIEELMSVAHLIFTKAGGLTTTECLAKGLPMLVYKVIPGQEEDNLNFILKYGAGARAATISEIIEKIVHLFSERRELLEMHRRAVAIGKPLAAKAIADFVVRQIAK